jgi:hypothetical protein
MAPFSVKREAYVMALAVATTRGVAPATLNGQAIPEIRVAPDTPLDDQYDIHFGLNVKQADNNLLYQGMDPDNDPRDKALMIGDGLGPRTIEMRRRGGRAAEHDWNVYEPAYDARQITVLGEGGMTRARFQKFNRAIPVNDAKRDFPPNAHIGTVDVSGQPKGYWESDPTVNKGKVSKADAKPGGHGGQLFGTRWSKTALEWALSPGQGMIHFHLTGMGDLANIFNKAGDYSHNVTSAELRYVRRWWRRFQFKVIFYNGYTMSEKAVEVFPPWLPSRWHDDTVTCENCDKKFSESFPHRLIYHCRMCGNCVCADCSPKKITLKYPVTKLAHQHSPQGSYRVCNDCYTEAHKRKKAPSKFT